LSADVALDAFFLVDEMHFIGFIGNGSRWTALSALGAADAIIFNGITDERKAFPGRTVSENMCFILFPEIV
jgi:hypothetical protein